MRTPINQPVEPIQNYAFDDAQTMEYSTWFNHPAIPVHPIIHGGYNAQMVI